MSRTIVLQAGAPQEFFEVSNFFRILAATSPFTVQFYNAGRLLAEAVDVMEGYAERFDIGTFDRVRLVSPLTQTVQFVQRLGNTVSYDKAPVGDVQVVGGLMQVSETPPLPTHFWGSGATALQASPMVVFLPAANVNGAIIWSAEGSDATSSTTLVQGFVAKNGVPASIGDGDVVAQSEFSQSATAQIANISMQQPRRIAPGLGLYFVTSQNGGGAWFRSCRYTLLP
jgi:hypothetical protein